MSFNAKIDPSPLVFSPGVSICFENTFIFGEIGRHDPARSLMISHSLSDVADKI